MEVDGVRARLYELRDRRVDTLAVDTLPIAMREAAVLLLLWEQYGEAWLALTRRGSALRTHASHISLPGGVCLDLVHWLGGRDRRRVPDRMQGLKYLVQTGGMA